MKYDDASWHYGGEFPKGLPRKNGATHIGMFLAWAIERDLAGDLHTKDDARMLALVKARKMTGARFLIECCDEKLTNDELNDEGDRFAQKYYEKTYFNDYWKVFGDEVDSLYEVRDTWTNYDRIKPVLDRRLDAWRRRNGRAAAPAKKRMALKKAPPRAPRKKS